MNPRFRSLFATGTALATVCVLTSIATAKDAPWDMPSKYVFAQSVGGFEFQGNTLVLKKATSTAFFGKGEYGLISNEDFADLWRDELESPYATLHILGEGEVVLALDNPKADGDRFTYDASVVSGAPPSRSTAGTLFIDPARSAPAAAKGPEPINERDRKARETIAVFKQKDPGLEKFFDSAAGWAVFPTVAKGGLVVGGARGDGVVYVKDEVIGYSTLSQGTIGLQIGGQAYSEIIFFEDEAALSHFKKGNAELSAQASAVAVTAGASADAGYADGVAIFTIAKGGAMLEASVGGQGFSFDPR